MNGSAASINIDGQCLETVWVKTKTRLLFVGCQTIGVNDRFEKTANVHGGILINIFEILKRFGES